ncbi:hypothetical protein AGMMS49992_17860 [Clostridia bacterium]|nr:hypothetical protein AGMMS49992_17860 [Clostridia bacterium]
MHVLLRRNDTDFSLLYPERDSSENIVHANGNWTLTLRLDANTRNVVGLEAGQYYAAFTETNAQGNVLLEAGNNVWINIKSCEKAELKFNFSEGQTLSCSGGALTLSGYGAGANAEINVWLTRKSNGAIVRMIVGHADQNGIWSATLNSAQVGPYVGAPCIPDGDYYVFAYQTQYDGFMRESQKITVHISNCCA